MHLRKYAGLGLLIVLLLAAGYGVFATRSQPPAAAPAAPTGRTAAQSGLPSVDVSSLETVEALLRMPTAPEERAIAESALRLADKASDLAFAQSVWRMAARPPAATAEAQQIVARLQAARRTLDSNSATVARLTAAITKAKSDDAAKLKDQLDLAKAMQTLDQDEVDDAEQDLMGAGGNPQVGFEEMIRQHDAASQSSDTLRITVAPPTVTRGLFHRLEAWSAIRDKKTALERAAHSADSTAKALQQRHDSLQARAAVRLRASAAVSHDSTQSLVAEATRQSMREKAMTTLDRRVDNQHQLAAALTRWTSIVRDQERAAINRMLRDVVTLLAIVLGGLLLIRWADETTAGLSMDRRRRHTLRILGRVAVQVLGILMILLVIFGPPNNIGTLLGLAGAGLTVALKDFITGFIGWFVLMGPDGIRPGDLVEINGVTGEVVEIGLFQTVMLETGGWTGAGHATGRRVTFTNGFAVEGHYFNFSTSGQWMWDEVEIVVPEGRDPYPIAEALRAEVETTTAESARQAEAEWKGARRTPQFATLTAAPTVNVRPIIGGAEVTVRYVTRLSERAAARSRLYRGAMELLGATARP